MSLGERLKMEREKRKWSQKYVAEKIGITNTVLSNYERDYRDPDTETLRKLAELYDVPTDYLLGRTDKPNPINNQEEDTPISIAFSHGGEGLTEDELEHLEQELKRYRELKARFMREKNRD